MKKLSTAISVGTLIVIFLTSFVVFTTPLGYALSEFWASNTVSGYSMGDFADNSYINATSQKILIETDYRLARIMITEAGCGITPSVLGTWFVGVAATYDGVYLWNTTFVPEQCEYTVLNFTLSNTLIDTSAGYVYVRVEYNGTTNSDNTQNSVAFSFGDEAVDTDENGQQCADGGWSNVPDTYFYFGASDMYENEDWTKPRHDQANSGLTLGTVPTGGWEMWKTDIGHTLFLCGPIVSDERLFVCDNDGGVNCLDIADGSVLWRVDGWDDIQMTPSIANMVGGGDGMLFVGDKGGNVSALDPETGELIWSNLWNSAAVSGLQAVDGMVIYISNNQLVALNWTDGSYIWNCYIGESMFNFPVVGGVVYVACWEVEGIDHSVKAVDEFTGTLLWSSLLSDYTTSNPTVDAGMVFEGDMDNYIYCMNATTGDQIWNNTLPNYNYFSSPAVWDGKVYFGYYEGGLCCFNETTGAFLWNYSDVGLGVLGSPAIAEGKIVFGAGAYLFVVNATDGTEIWRYSIWRENAYVDVGPALSNGMIFVVTTVGDVFALAEPREDEYWASEEFDHVTSIGDYIDDSWSNNVSQKIIVPWLYPICRVMVNFTDIIGAPEELGEFTVGLADTKDGVFIWSTTFVPQEVENTVKSWDFEPFNVTSTAIYLRLEYSGTTDLDSTADEIQLAAGVVASSTDEYYWWKYSGEWEQPAQDYLLYGVSQMIPSIYWLNFSFLDVNEVEEIPDEALTINLWNNTEPPILIDYEWGEATLTAGDYLVDVGYLEEVWWIEQASFNIPNDGRNETLGPMPIPILHYTNGLNERYVAFSMATFGVIEASETAVTFSFDGGETYTLVVAGPYASEPTEVLYDGAPVEYDWDEETQAVIIEIYDATASFYIDTALPSVYWLDFDYLDQNGDPVSAGDLTFYLENESGPISYTFGEATLSGGEYSAYVIYKIELEGGLPVWGSDFDISKDYGNETTEIYLSVVPWDYGFITSYYGNYAWIDSVSYSDASLEFVADSESYAIVIGNYSVEPDAVLANGDPIEWFYFGESLAVAFEGEGEVTFTVVGYPSTPWFYVNFTSLDLNSDEIPIGEMQLRLWNYTEPPQLISYQWGDVSLTAGDYLLDIGFRNIWYFDQEPFSLPSEIGNNTIELVLPILPWANGYIAVSDSGLADPELITVNSYTDTSLNFTVNAGEYGGELLILACDFTKEPLTVKYNGVQTDYTWSPAQESVSVTITDPEYPIFIEVPTGGGGSGGDGDDNGSNGGGSGNFLAPIADFINKLIDLIKQIPPLGIYVIIGVIALVALGGMTGGSKSGTRGRQQR